MSLQAGITPAGRRRRFLILVSLAAFLVPALGCHAAERFNLDCKGSFIFHRNNYESTSEPIEIKYRIDTVEKRMCVEPCTAVKAIPAVTPDKLILHVYKMWEDMRSVEIDRTSGNLEIHVDYFNYKNVVGRADIYGRCVKMSFTGFPAPKF